MATRKNKTLPEMQAESTGKKETATGDVITCATAQIHKGNVLTHLSLLIFRELKIMNKPKTRFFVKSFLNLNTMCTQPGPVPDTDVITVAGTDPVINRLQFPSSLGLTII